MAISKRHHYIPQFYLRGFTNENGEYYLYDKEKDEIRKTKPINTFFENKRNTSVVGDEESDLLEKIYAHFDGLAAPFFQEMKDMMPENIELTPEALARFKMFIPQLFWRIPKNDEVINKLTDNLPFKLMGCDLVDKDGHSILTPELEKSLKHEDIFRKMYPVLVPFITHNEIFRNNEYDTWKVYCKNKNCLLISDNPLIVKNLTDFGSLTKEIIFPICSNKILVHTCQAKPTQMPNLFIFELDALTILQAKRFVCCADENYLKQLLKIVYPKLDSPEMEIEMKKSLFLHFQ